MVARRTIDFGTPSGKRRKTTGGQTLHKAILKNQELKRFITDVTTGPADVLVHSLVATMASGAGGNQRIGNKVKILSVDYCVTNANNGLTRVRLVMGRGQTPPSAPTPANFTRYLDENAYWVLRDETFVASTEGGNDKACLISTHKFPSGLNLQFDATAVLQKNLYLVITSKDGSLANDIKASTQVNYKEI